MEVTLTWTCCDCGAGCHGDGTTRQSGGHVAESERSCPGRRVYEGRGEVTLALLHTDRHTVDDMTRRLDIQYFKEADLM